MPFSFNTGPGLTFDERTREREGGISTKWQQELARNQLENEMLAAKLKEMTTPTQVGRSTMIGGMERPMGANVFDRLRGAEMALAARQAPMQAPGYSAPANNSDLEDKLKMIKDWAAQFGGQNKMTQTQDQWINDAGMYRRVPVKTTRTESNPEQLLSILARLLG